MDLRDQLVLETIKFPVRYDNRKQSVMDSKDMMVCDIRGWGRIQYMGKSEERQDAIGERIANLLNEFYEENEYHYETAAKMKVVRKKSKEEAFELD